MVLYPWLVAIYLQESPERVGLAQMAGQLPMLLLILWGGVLGDRLDQRRLLIGLQAAMILPPLVMAGLAFSERLTYPLLFAWALIGGVFAAFAQPARDALLNRVAGDRVQHVVTLAIGVQFGVQIVGFGIGSLAATTGVTVLLMIQSAFMLAAAFATRRIPLAPVGGSGAAPRLPPVAALREGIRAAWESPAIRPAVVQVFSVGVFFAGTYMVLLPLMVRDLYQGSSVGIALAFAANMLGTCTTIFFLIRRGGVDRPGRALLCGSLVSLSVLSLLHFELPMWAFYLVVYAWGLCGGIGMTMSRSIVQEAAAPEQRARVMSVYSLGMMGGMPIGSLLIGWGVGAFGARGAVWIPVVGMLAITLWLIAFSKLWNVRAVMARH